MEIPFAEYAPDQAKLNSSFTDYIRNVLCAAGHYIPLPQCAAISNALGATPLGGIAVLDDSGSVHVFVGTATNLFKLNTSDYSWDYVSKLGSELVTNGAFTTDTGWTKGSGVDINSTTSEKCHFGSVADAVGVSQTQGTTNATIYKTVVTISSFSAGGAHVAFTGGTPVEGTSRTADGTFTEYLTGAGSNTTIALLADGTTTLDADDYSVKALTIYGASTANRWRFKVFGATVCAFNGVDNNQIYTLGSSTEFTDMAGSPPIARDAAVSGNDRMILYGLTGNPRKIQWCDTDDISDWSTGTAGSQTFPDGGDVMGVSDATNPIIVQKAAIRFGQFVPGSSATFTFTKIYSNRGCFARYSFCQRSENLFFADSGGFFQINAAGELLPIGFEKVDREIFENIAATEIVDILGTVDPFYSRAYFLIRNTSTGDEYDLMLSYDWLLQKWAPADVSLYFMMPAFTIGYTLSGLDVYTDLSGVPAPFGSKIWQGGAPVMGGFDADNKLCYFNGDNAEATLRTQEIGDPAGAVQMVQSVGVILDSLTYTLRLGGRLRRSEGVTWTAYKSPSTVIGRVLARIRSRFLSAEVVIPAGTDWEQAQGIDVDVSGSGSR